MKPYDRELEPYEYQWAGLAGGGKGGKGGGG